jgi:hypothetical protein
MYIFFLYEIDAKLPNLDVQQKCEEISIKPKSETILFMAKRISLKACSKPTQELWYLPLRLSVNPNCVGFKDLQRNAIKVNSLNLEISFIPENFNRCTARVKREIMHSAALLPSVCSNDWQRDEAGQSAAWL